MTWIFSVSFMLLGASVLITSAGAQKLQLQTAKPALSDKVILHRPLPWLRPRPQPKAWEYEISDYSDHPCKRECTKRGRPMTCKYVFVVENYYTLSRACQLCPFNQSHCSLPHCVAADGERRAIKVVNRMMPGPAIEVCQGDRLIITVVNRLEPSEVTTIHWHGQLQRRTPHMDGVGLITQCPIGFNSKFTYRFKAVDAGTHYWHAHSGPQRADGVYGALIVRKPKSFRLDPNSGLYSHDLSDHVILIGDWTEDSATDRLTKYTHVDYDAKPRLMLVNGKGRHAQILDDDSTVHYTPHAEFKVTPGQRYRFRLISNGIMNCPIQFSIDNHTMTIIESDGHSLLPFVVDSIIVNSGERYDFVLNADQTSPLRNYWIRLHGYNNCAMHKATQTAILKYDGAPDVLPPEPTTWEDAIRDGFSLNPALLDNSSPAVSAEISDLFAATFDSDLHATPQTPDMKIFLGIEFHGIENKVAHHPELYPFNGTYGYKFYSPHINWISNQMPPSPPLTQLGDLPSNQFCNIDTLSKDCKQEWCACTHHYKLALNALVELVIVDEGILSHAYHPMHLHGHKFSVVAMGKIGEKTTVDAVKALDEAGKITRRIERAPIKDTVIVPDGGYTVIRFKANNPGFWLFHCHVEFHSAMGMSMVFQVGEQKDFPRAPRNFQKCGDSN
ncbi:multicopper oxidase [Plakobranchus ocellatus]|uniref:Multicopper oxidase n=1 Tax=Plakobranchus ocellatus TaxID=259542 RepID=A0AAV4C9J8_9GAST|nr:multicopper oxidase [Plakobranchus ocellatus]